MSLVQTANTSIKILELEGFREIGITKCEHLFYGISQNKSINIYRSDVWEGLSRVFFILCKSMMKYVKAVF